MEVEELKKLLPEVHRAVGDNPNVFGFGIGAAEHPVEPGDLRFVIYVKKGLDPGLARAIPQQIAGVPTRLIETGPFVPLINNESYRPIPGGVEVVNSLGLTGTLGCFLKSEAYSSLFMLSNNHVLARFNDARAGEEIKQGGSRAGELFRFPLLWDTLKADCAVAKVDVSNLPDAASPSLGFPVLVDYFGVRHQHPMWLGTQTADIGIAYLTSGGSQDLVIFQIDAPAGPNQGYLFVDRPGNVPQPIGGWFGDDTQAAGLAIADVSGNGKPDAIVFFVDHGAGGNQGYYRIGWDLASSGICARWDPHVAIPGDWGTQTAGGGVAAVDFDGNGKIDLVCFYVDAPAGGDQGFLRFVKDLEPATGIPANWGRLDPFRLPGFWGTETQGADIAYMGTNARGDRHRFALIRVDNPVSENGLVYRSIEITADVSLIFPGNKSTEYNVLGWVGDNTSGVGLAYSTGIAGGSLTVATVDAPGGQNVLYLRQALAIPGTIRNRFGAPLSLPAPVTIRDYVWKSGKTSNVTAGRVEALHTECRVDMSEYNQPDYRVQDCIVVHPGIISPGDSGSLLVTGTGEALALLQSGDPERSIGMHIETVLQVLRGSSVYGVGDWLGRETSSASASAFTWLSAPPKASRTNIVVAYVNPGDVGRIRVGFDIDSNGQARGANSWTDLFAVPDWDPGPNQGIGVAVGEIAGRPKPSLVALRVDRFGAYNKAWLYIGHDFDEDGTVKGGWKKKEIEWRAGDSQGVDVCLADLDGSGQLAVIVMNVDNNPGGNVAWYRVGSNLQLDGTAGWTGDWIPVQAQLGNETAGAGIVAVDINNDQRPELVFFYIDEKAGGNEAFYCVGWNPDKSGRAPSWPAYQVGGWWGDRTQGAGLAAAVLTESNRPNLILLHVDNPPGLNTAYYRVVYDVMPNGEPAKWSIA